ncbi:MAG: hypothetical protein IT210_23585 [Armatimonadetes bacterium]|nr:hypothetical protein [Armatimonadota bacterium]
MQRRSKEAIADEIRKLFEADEDLSYGHMEKNHVALFRAAVRRFGSWKEAIAAAGLDYEEIRKYKVWTAERIVERIRELAETGEDLSWYNVSEKLDPQLAAAAIRKCRYGSWKKAVEAAGLDYDIIRKYQSWTEDRILARIQEMAQDGIELNSKKIQQTDITLFTAARRRFDSWDNALAQAGLDFRSIRLRAPFRSRETTLKGSDN